MDGRTKKQKYSVFFKITQPLFFIDGIFESKQEAEKEFKKEVNERQRRRIRIFIEVE